MLPSVSWLLLTPLVQIANESLSALRTVQAFNSQRQEELKFHERVENVLGFARKEAIASAIFFGSTGWSGNVTLLALLGYGNGRFLIIRIHLLIYSRRNVSFSW